MLCFLLCLGASCELFGQDTAEECLKLGASLVSNSPGEAIFYLTRAIKLNPSLGSAYRHRARALEKAGNLDAAYTDLTRAVELEAKTSSSYFELAELQQAKGNVDAAFLSFTRAIDIDPKNAVAYFSRGRIREEKHDLDGAATDYSHAIRADSEKLNSGVYYEYRGNLRKYAGDLDGAIADYGEAIKDARRNTFYLGEPSFQRGSALYMKHALKEALGDFRWAAANCRDRSNWVPRLHFWLVRVRMGEQEAADKELSDFVTDKSSAKYVDEWGKKFTGFILGQIPQSDLLAYAGVRGGEGHEADLECMIWYYTGIKRLIAGDKAEAVDCFKKSVAIEMKCAPEEYYWARCELKTLEPAAKK